jgi:hypothetical protein
VVKITMINYFESVLRLNRQLSSKVIELWGSTFCNTQVVNYELPKKIKIITFIITDAEALEQDKEKAPSPRKAKLFKCGHHLCPGLGIFPDKECFTCEVIMP